MAIQDKPLAAPGLTSYRYPGMWGSWCMIGARGIEEALREAQRSVSTPVSMAKLQVWDGQKYVPVWGLSLFNLSQSPIK